MKFHLAGNGLDPRTELERHEKLAAYYREHLRVLGRKHNWRYREALNLAVWHEEEAAKLRKEKVI